MARTGPRVIPPTDLGVHGRRYAHLDLEGVTSVIKQGEYARMEATWLGPGEKSRPPIGTLVIQESRASSVDVVTSSRTADGL